MIKRFFLQVLLACFCALAAPQADAGRIIGLKAPAAGSGSATVTWVIPETSVSTSQIGTKVYKSTDRVTWTLVATIADTTTTSAAIGSLTTGTWYFEVSSYNAAGEGDLSNSGQSKTI